MNKYKFFENETRDVRIAVGSVLVACGILVFATEFGGEESKTQAIVYGNNTATIVDVDSKQEEDGFVKIETKAGLVMEVASDRVQFIETDNSNFTAEDIAIYYAGEDVSINYLTDDKESSKVKVRTLKDQ